ncbi:MAG TPA: FMN-binding protein [Pseudolysinimonas sp.]
MRKRAIAASVLASMGILTVGWQVGMATTVTPTSSSGDTASGTAGSSGTSGSSMTSDTGSSSSTASTSALKDGTYTGTSEQTRFGDVQVQVTISGGKITDVAAVHLTDEGGRSVQISNYAAPILRKEVLASQSAKVSNVGGATYTTDGYLQSVQSALDQASS